MQCYSIPHMNYSLDDIPEFGSDPVVWMDIMLQEQVLGRIHFRLYRDVFPAGVENFIRIACGRTVRAEHKGTGANTYVP